VVAQWVPRERADGGVSVQIKWRQDGRWQSETFRNFKLASEFRTAVEAAGDRWPAGWVPGEGWEVPEPEPPAATFADVATGAGGYFERQAKRVKLGKIKAYTVYRDRRTYELHLEEIFGHLPFGEVDIDDVGDWVDQQLDAGAAPKSIRNRHGLLSSIIKHGRLRMKLRRDSPCEATELPDVAAATSEVRQVRFFRPDEWALFRSCCDEDVHLMLDVKLATGMRWGEVTAFRPEDVAFVGDGSGLAANIHIVRAWSRRAPDDESEINVAAGETKRWVLGPPKNRRSRWVVVTGATARKLQAAVSEHGLSDCVFQSVHGNPWRYPDFHQRRWTPARKRAEAAGLSKRVTPHMLRHSAVVWSLAGGVPIEKISEMVGHASIQITYDIYGGLLNLQDPAMAEAMAKAMLTSSQAIGPHSNGARQLAPAHRPHLRRPHHRRVS
jgi:integrase